MHCPAETYSRNINAWNGPHPYLLPAPTIKPGRAVRNRISPARIRSRSQHLLDNNVTFTHTINLREVRRSRIWGDRAPVYEGGGRSRAHHAHGTADRTQGDFTDWGAGWCHSSMPYYMHGTTRIYRSTRFALPGSRGLDMARWKIYSARRHRSTAACICLSHAQLSWN